jgi:hypothetical protein
MFRVLWMFGFDVWDVPDRIIYEILDSRELPVIRRILAQWIATGFSGFFPLGCAMALSGV